MKQTFNIPKDCDKVSFEQIGNQIVTTFEPKFKNGDIVTLQYGNRDYVSYICIYSDKKYWFGINSKDKLVINGISNDDDANVKLDIANDLQRKLLFSKLKEKGYKYNEDTYELDVIKWVPKRGDGYVYVDTISGIINIIDVNFIPEFESDINRIKLGNYFKPGTLDKEKVKRLYAEFIQNVKDEHGIDY